MVGGCAFRFLHKNESIFCHKEKIERRFPSHIKGTCAPLNEMSTECPVCIEPSNGNENVLSCRHSLCVNCTDEIRQRQPYQSALNTVGEENVKCPICRQVCEPSYEELVMLVLNLKEEKGHSEKTMEFQLARNKKMVDVLSELMKYREQSKKMLANLTVTDCFHSERLKSVSLIFFAEFFNRSFSHLSIYLLFKMHLQI